MSLPEIYEGKVGRGKLCKQNGGRKDRCRANIGAHVLDNGVGKAED